MRPFQHLRTTLSVLLVALLTVGLGLVSAGTAGAAGSTLFDQTFKNATANGTGAVVLPKPADAQVSNAACLTATGNPSATGTGPLYSCPVASGNANNTPGSGALQLTAILGSQVGGVFAATSVPTSQGLDVSFTLNQYGGNGADGIVFALSAVDPTNPTAPPSIGPVGGFLGYSGSSSQAGLANAYLGFGFDVFGNFSNTSFQGTGCAASTLVKTGDKVPGQVLVRGPGNSKTGYCALNGTGTNASTTIPAVVPLKGTTRANSAVPVQIVINSSKSPVLVANTNGGTGSTLTVPAESYLTAFTPVGGAQRQLTGTLPVMAAALVGGSSWLDSDGLPKQLAFGWVASTGGSNDSHEVSNVKVSSLSSVTQLSVSQTSYTPTGTAFVAGDPIGYVVTAGVVSPGLPENGKITVTETVPANVKPLAASGTGWVCAAPVGQTITCTNSTSPFAAGSSLSPITVSAQATGAVTQSAIQGSSVITASSDTGLAGYSSSSPAGTNPAAPTITALSPTFGSTAGGSPLTITGTNLTGVTSIQVGTATELAAATGTTLLKCPGAAAAGCFTVSGSTLVISSMPAHLQGGVGVKVVNLGTSASSTYNYLAVPGTPVVSATAAITGATVTWTTPANGGSAISNYSVQGFKNGTAVPALTRTIATGTNSYAYTGLDAGGTYTFTVAATNALAYGSAGTSNPVVPYTVSTAPLSPTAIASSGQAEVSWLAPSSDGSSPITGYSVTPYLGATAQTPQLFASTNLTQTVVGLTPGSSYQFTVAAINAAGTGAPSAKTTAVVINALPTLALPAPVAGEVGAGYNNPAFTVAGGTGPFAWSVLSGTLPPGISLSAGGVLSGTPTAAGSSTFTVQVTDAAGKTASQALTLAVVAAPVLANPAPPNGQVGVGYSNQLAVQGGTGPFAWSISAGALPPGISIGASTGLLSGSPTTAGSSSFTVSVTDAKGQTATQPLTLVVTASPSLSFPAPPGAQVGVGYTDQLVVTGGTGPFSWSSTGALPPGLTLNPATGLLSGTPTAAGSYPVTIRVQDSKGQNASQAVTLSVAASPTLAFTPAAGEAGAAYTTGPVLAGGTGPFTYSVSAGTLPAGLSIAAANGAITGTPTAAGSSTVTLRVVDAYGQSATATGTIVIGTAPSLANPPLPGGDVTVAYSRQLVVTGGAGPFAWAIATGSLPAGLTLDPATGVLAGTPTTGGSSTFVVRVTDGFGLSASQQLTLLIRGASSVTLAGSAGSVSPGTSVGLTAAVTPPGATGTVTFTDTITSGPDAGTSTVIGSAPVGAGGIAQTTVALGAFGAHSIVAAYAGDSATVGSASAPTVVEVVATAGSLIVSEFRLSGPAGAADQYVELTNVSPDPVALGGFKVALSSGTVTTIPVGPVLAAGRTYLVGGADYSLGAVAAADLVAAGSLGSGGVEVLAPDTAATQTDAVGSVVAGYHLGTPLPPFSGTPTAQFGWVRTQQNSYLKNTSDNAADFALVSTAGGLVGGVQSMLGSPSPTSLTSPWQQTFSLPSTLVDPSVAATLAPNRVTVRVKPGVPGSIVVRRVITNQTADTVTTMRLRVRSLSEANGLTPTFAVPAGPTAALRAVNPATPTTSITVNGQTVVVQNLSVEAPVTGAPGGGLNSTFPVALPPGGLAPGQSVTVGFSFVADTAGTFWFGYDVDAAGLG